jgi:hypothetical protein
MLTLIGLILNFIGSAVLIYDAFFNFGKERTVTYITHPWDDDREEIVKSVRTKEGYKEIRGIGMEQKILMFSLILIILGFLLQVLDFPTIKNWLLKFLHI